MNRFPYAIGVHVSAEAALTQVEQPEEQCHWYLHTGCPTWVAVQQAKTCKLANLCERRDRAHIGGFEIGSTEN